MSKGSKRRIEDFKKVQENWETIEWEYSKNKKNMESKEDIQKMEDYLSGKTED